MLRVLPPTSNLACTKSGLLTGLNMGGKMRNNDFQLRCSNVAKQVACFLLLVSRTFTGVNLTVPFQIYHIFDSCLC